MPPKSKPLTHSRFSPIKKGPLPHPHRHERFSLATVEAAIRRHRGMIARAARALRCTPQTIRNYMQRHPAIAQVVADERALIVDTAELKLHEAVRRGEGWAICFTLKCLGKDRGYVERQERPGPDAAPLNPGDQQNTVIIADGNKEQYIEKLRQAREMVRAAQGARIDGMVVASPADGNAKGGNGSC